MGQPGVVSVNPRDGRADARDPGRPALLPVRHRRPSRRLAARHELRRLQRRQDGRSTARTTSARSCEIDPATNEQSILSRNAPQWGNLFRNPLGVTVEPGGRILVVNQNGGTALVAVDPRDRRAGRGDAEHGHGPARGAAAARADPGRRRGDHRLHARRPRGRARVGGPPERGAEHPAPGPAALQQPARRGGGGEPPAGARRCRRRPPPSRGGRAGELRRLALVGPRAPAAPLRLGPRRQRQLRDRRRHEPADHARVRRARRRSPRACG